MDIKKEISKFAPVEIPLRLNELDEQERELVRKLIEAGKLIGKIYMKQTYSKNFEVLSQLENSDKSEDKDKLTLFKIYSGPFNKLHDNKPFVSGHERPKGGAFYPSDITKEEFLDAVAKNPLLKDELLSEYTVIRRHEGKLVPVKYSVEYSAELKEAAALLREAASFSEESSLKKFLESRAEAFLTNEYNESDKDWMDITGKIEVVIGPYEVYEDELMSAKATFESLIGIKDAQATEELQMIKEHLPELENQLTFTEYQKRSGSESPMIVINEIYSSGEPRAGVHFSAFNLPNSEVVREEKGSKKVMLKNIMNAKYDACTSKIVKMVLSDKDIANADFESYFKHVVLHEVSHGIGPSYLEDGRTVKESLQETYPTLEEAKADVLGVTGMIRLAKMGVYSSDYREKAIASFIGGIFRSVRFGVHEAHGGANMLIHNYVHEKNGFQYNNEGRIEIDYTKAEKAFLELEKEILQIQAEGSYAKSKAMLVRYNKMHNSVQALLTKMEDIPIDILPVYEAEK